MDNIDYIYSDEKLPTKMIVWDLGRRCNFDCSYCTGWMHSTTAPFNSLEKYKEGNVNVVFIFHTYNGGIAGGGGIMNKLFLLFDIIFANLHFVLIVLFELLKTAFFVLILY